MTSTDTEEWQLLVRQYKAKADAAFGSSNFDEAIRIYSNALELDPQNHVLLSNRSAANLKASNKSKSLADAKACIASNPKFVKGHTRLGASQQSLGRWRDAKETFRHVLTNLDRNNPVAKKGFEDCEIMITNEEKAPEEAEVDPKKEDSMNPEEDLLNDFFSEVETTATEKEKEIDPPPPRIIINQKKGLGTAQQQIERLLAENYQWKNLNPFCIMDLPHTSTEDEIGRKYKAFSLLLHPDKCRYKKDIDENRAKTAYDEIQRAKKQLDDEDKARHVRGLVEQGMRTGKQAWQKLNREGTLESVQAKEVQRIFAQVEYSRREVDKRERNYEQRERQQEEDELEKERRERRFDKNWREGTRVDKRIGNWRDFQKKEKKQKA